MPANKRRWATLALVSVSVAVMCTACARQEPDRTGVGAALLQEGRWEDAANAFKGQLLRHPCDVAAHFYLGRCYLNDSPMYPGAAAGEFETALRLFSGNGRHSPIAEYADDYFELRCHLELAKVYLRAHQEYLEGGVPKTVLKQLLRKLKRAAEAAEQIMPDSEDVVNLKRIVEAL